VGSVVPVSGVVTNAGTVLSGVFYVGLYLNGERVGSFRVPSLGPGGSYLINSSFVAAEGVNVVRFAADYNNSVPEGNESDNDLSYTCFAASPADLSVVSSGVSLSTYGPVLGAS